MSVAAGSRHCRSFFTALVFAKPVAGKSTAIAIRGATKVEGRCITFFPVCNTDAKLLGKYGIGMLVKCLVQPGDGVMPLVKAITHARNRIEIVIFRFNRSEIESALANAVTRGVNVHALIAYTNRGGEKNLRDLELRLLAAGVTVSRTDDDLVRYHGKLMLVDRRQLFLLAFNFTFLDIERSRAFGIITTNRNHVREAAKLFEADTKRIAYTPEALRSW